ncbi:MAG: hypothetical protein LAP40_02620 [Acidobacteriia bacterium]|nr:hypothetical protein [Terriglobia bacterium]
MTCPFLKEAEVAYCQSATVRTLIPLAQATAALEKCASPEHVSCSMYQAQAEQSAEIAACPHLRQSLMQYCAASPVTKFIPYSESLTSRCNENFRYCEAYLKMAHPPTGPGSGDELPAPDWLLYSANHMWLDLAGDNICHAGIDSFLSRVLGKIDAVTYVHQKGRQRPAAVLTVHGIDVDVVFPNPFRLTACNLNLRANPSRIATEPYTSGWLFEGVPGPETTAHLRQGAEAREWMSEEARRMNQYLQEFASVSADGGMFSRDLAALLPRAKMLALFHEFFSPFASQESEL